MKKEGAQFRQINDRLAIDTGATLMSAQQQPSADQVEDLFTIHLSPEGSNNRTAEETVVTFWRDYLQDAEGN